MLQHIIKAQQEEAKKSFEPVLSLLDKGDEYIRNSDYDKGLPSSRYLTEHKLNTLISQTVERTVEAAVEIAWEYIVEDTRNESWSKERLEHFIKDQVSKK